MSSRKKKRETPLLEWLSAGTGLAIVLGMFGFLVLDAIRADTGAAPLMRARAAGLTVAPGEYVVQVEVSNSSRRTGASVHIVGDLQEGGRTVESSDATLSYVPGQSQRRAGLVFTRDPRDFCLHLRVTGYERP